MMSEQQFETVLTAVADVQVAVDALGLDVERLLGASGIRGEDDDLELPEWVNGRQGVTGCHT
jgi:hypothetical protein